MAASESLAALPQTTIIEPGKVAALRNCMSTLERRLNQAEVRGLFRGFRKKVMKLR